MSGKEAISAFSISCVGAYPKELPLSKPAAVTITVYQNGTRQVGCSFLSRDGKGLCEVTNVHPTERLSCVHRSPQQFTPDQSENSTIPEGLNEWAKGPSAIVLRNGHYDYYQKEYEGVDVEMAQWHKLTEKRTEVITLVTISQSDRVLLREDAETVYQQHEPSFQAWIRLCDKYGYNNGVVEGAWYSINYSKLVRQEEITPEMQAVTKEEDFKLLNFSMEQQFRSNLLKRFIFKRCGVEP